MKSVIFGLSLASAAAAQVAGTVSMVPAATVTTAPDAVQKPSSFYDQMSYDSYKSGGYKQLECGYGYYKSSDGHCQQESWVRHIPRSFSTPG